MMANLLIYFVNHSREERGGREAFGGLARPGQGATWPVARIWRPGMRARRTSERERNEALPAWKTERPLGM